MIIAGAGGAAHLPGMTASLTPLPVFGVPINGNLWLLLALSTLFLVCALGLGLLVSTLAKTQLQAMQFAFLMMLPSVLLSGFMFPIENMPRVFQYLTYLNPLRYFLIIIRGLFLKGNGLDILWPQMAALFVIGTVVITLSAMRFRKRLG